MQHETASVAGENEHPAKWITQIRSERGGFSVVRQAPTGAVVQSVPDVLILSKFFAEIQRQRSIPHGERQVHPVKHPEGVAPAVPRCKRWAPQWLRLTREFLHPSTGRHRNARFGPHAGRLPEPRLRPPCGTRAHPPSRSIEFWSRSPCNQLVFSRPAAAWTPAEGTVS